MIDWWILGPEPWERSDWLSLGQLLFTFVGFLLAIIQLRRTAVATEATAKRVSELQVRLLTNDLLVALPTMHKLEDDLDDAVKADNHAAVERGLVAYARTASTVAALLEVRGGTAEVALVKLLNQAGRAATKAKSEIAEGTPRGLRDVVRVAMSKMSAVSTETSAMMARLQRKVDED